MAAPRPLRVLVVDDLLDARDSLRALVELWGHEAHTAENGKAAVEMVLSHCYDAVILDLHMPVMDGMMAAEIIGRQERRPLLIAYSAFVLVDRTRAEAVGFDLLLEKASANSIDALERALGGLQPA
jgi:CheY-like chemotaxis protein